ncbi:MAG TPA: ABC transporter substrate-binding protein [bacterium]|nr:ABC transporter substrate-binding protein [bacterium]HQL62341.1 ABC transporter substrate-binding protein [bacterium]
MNGLQRIFDTARAICHPQIGLTSFAILLMMTGCGNRQADSLIELTFWHAWGGYEGKYLEDLVREFNDTHTQIRVKPAFFIIGDKLMAAIAGGIPPDIATVWDWMLPTMGEAGCFLPLNDYLQRAGLGPEDYLPNVWDYGMFSEKKFGVPTALNVWMIFYNKRLFTEAGLDPKSPPADIASLTECARRLTRRDATGKLERIGFIPEFQYSYIWMWNFGGDLYDRESRHFIIDSPENVQAVKWIASLYREYGIDNYRRFVATFGEYDSPNNPFYKEKLAMREDGQWQISFIRHNAPDLDYGLIPFVSAVRDRESQSAMTGSFWVIPEGCRNPDAAWTFLSWLIAPAQSARFASTLYNVPPLRAALNDPAYADVYRSRMRVFIDFLLEGRARPLPALPIGQFFYNEFNNIMEEICSGALEPEAGLPILDNRLQRELDRSLRHLGITEEHT